ncbi:MAG: hypothetical protein H7068_04810, partial [Pedobacter sp.]|nr:hypothetical protein [Chitinophagaceae bacterium]
MIATVNCIAQKPQLIFQTGFEGSSHVVKDYGTDDHGAVYEHIAGKDNRLKTKSNWDKDWISVLKNGTMQVQYTGGDSTKRFAQVEPELGNPSNHV